MIFAYNSKIWEELELNEKTDLETYRMKVFGGWVVALIVDQGDIKLSTCFVPDEYHQWINSEELQNGRKYKL